MTDLPCPLPGHWNATDGHAMAMEYALKTREQLCDGGSTDMLVAFEIASLRRDDPPGMFEPTLAAARDRIRWLSVHLAMATQEKAVLLEVTRDTVERYGFRPSIQTKESGCMVEAGNRLADLVQENP